MSDPARQFPDERHVPRVRLTPEAEAELRAGLDDLDAGRTVEVLPEELVEWAETGVMPASIDARMATRLAELGCVPQS